MKYVVICSSFILFVTNYISAQNVGIGTTTPHPNAILELQAVNKGLLLPRGDANTRNPALKDNTAKGLLLFDTVLNTVWVHDGSATPLGWHEIQDATHGLWVRNGLHAYYNNTGNIGIGITAPTSRLQISGLTTSATPVIRAQVGYTGSSDVRGIESISEPALGYGIGVYAQGGYHGIRAVGNPAGSGGVSYGVYSTVTNTVISSKYGVYASATGPGTNYASYINASGGTSNYAIYANDGNSYLADSLWIGKTIGNTRFDMNGGKGDIDVSEGDFRIGTTTNRLKIGVFTTGTFAGMSRIYSSGTNAMLALGTNNMDILTLSAANNGTVVIGNGGALPAGATGYKLSIHGKAVCTELMVKSVATWPDYVFEKNYNLMPLTEVKDFIEKNKHLPGIPPAAEVESNGLQVGDMQNRLLKKIEELTLYILKQQQELDQQKEQLKKLNNQIIKQ